MILSKFNSDYLQAARNVGGGEGGGIEHAALAGS